MRIAYFGLPLAALLLLEDGHELTSVVLSPVDAPGRRRLGRRLAPSVPWLDARAHTPEQIEALIDATLRDTAPELLVSWFWTRQLQARWLAVPPLGAIGVHPSLLPRHRGPDPYYAAIDAGDQETGVTVHVLEPTYDTGAILAQRRLAVGERNAWQLARALDRPSLGALRELLSSWAHGRAPAPRPQEESLATWAPAPNGAQLQLDWSWDTARMLRRIRALTPLPGVSLEIDSVVFSVTRASACPLTPELAAIEPGEAWVGEEVILRTVDGGLRVESAELPPPDPITEDEEGGEEDGAVLVSGRELARLIGGGRAVVDSVSREEIG